MDTLIPINKDKPNKCIIWNCTEIFMKVGLMVERLAGQFRYFVDDKNTKVPKCGFRSCVFNWNGDANKFELADIDKNTLLEYLKKSFIVQTIVYPIDL